MIRTDTATQSAELLKSFETKQDLSL